MGQRDLTVLGGDLLGNDAGEIRHETGSRQDNSFHVVRLDRGADGVRIDGLTIADGNATYDSDNNNGGGILASADGELVMAGVAIRNCSARGFGGGIAVNGGELRAERLLVKGNYAHERGGGLSASGATIRLKNAEFRDNHADDWGGGMYQYPGGSAEMTDVLFASNYAAIGGGLMQRVPLVLANARFFGNVSGWEGGGLALNDVAEAEIANVVLAGNHAGTGEEASIYLKTMRSSSSV